MRTEPTPEENLEFNKKFYEIKENAREPCWNSAWTKTLPGDQKA